MATQTKLPLSQMDLGKGVLGGLDERERQLSEYSVEPIQQKTFNPFGSIRFDTTAITQAAASGLKDIGGSTFNAGFDLWKDYIKGSPSESQPKSPDAQEKEKKSNEVRWANQQQTQIASEVLRVIQSRELQDQVTAGVAGKSTEDKNRRLGFNAGYLEKNISNPYHIARIREQEKEEIRASERAKMSQEAAALNKKADFTNRLDAQEGQSSVSSSGAIRGAG